jgi:hypothetical protein
MKLSTRDWVQLSCYLDGELTPRELRQFEDRLKKDPVLKFALEELRQTKFTLQHTPRVKPPRNFILTPEMLGKVRRSQPAKAYQLAAALMSFLLVGVLVLDFGLRFSGGVMAPAASKELMLEAVSESAADAIDEPTLLGAEGDMDAEKAAEPQAAEELLAEEAPSLELAAGAGLEDQPAEAPQAAEREITGEADPAAAANQSEEWQQADEAADAPQPSQTSAPVLERAPEIETAPPAAYAVQEGNKPERGYGIDVLQIAELILGLGAIVLIITARVVKKRNS